MRASSEHAASYYAATVRHPATFPRLEGAVRADVAVVGAGFTGISAALTLAERGYDVVVLEANRVGWGASGRNGGQLEAYDAETGDRLWRFQTGAGANSTATLFEHDGTQYVAFLAGGNALAATAHGDNLWLFSLDGDRGPAQPPGQAEEGGEHAGQSPNETPEGGPGDPDAGSISGDDAR